MSPKIQFKKAVEINNLDVIKKFINHPEVNIGKTKNWALTIASQKGYNKLFDLLINDKNVDPTYKNNSAIKKATRYNSVYIFKKLFSDERVNIDSFIEKLYFDVVSVNCHEILEVLFKYKPNSFDKKLISNLTMHDYIDSIKVIDKDIPYNYSHSNNFLFHNVYNKIKNYRKAADEENFEYEYIDGNEDLYLDKLYEILDFYWQKKEVKQLLKTTDQSIYQELMKPELNSKIEAF